MSDHGSLMISRHQQISSQNDIAVNKMSALESFIKYNLLISKTC